MWKRAFCQKTRSFRWIRKAWGALVRIAAERGRQTKPGLKLGICGEHGGDPASIAFCEEVGLDYVSCSPYRVAGSTTSGGTGGFGGGDGPDRVKQ